MPAPDPRLVVVQALPKGDRAELAVEVMTELGVDEIVPWAASRSVAQWHGARGEKALERGAGRRARRPSRAAGRGCPDRADWRRRRRRRAARPADALVLHEARRRRWRADELPAGGERGRRRRARRAASADDELDRFAAAGAAAVRLGEPVLRTSTAGAAALAALSLRLGRWA